MVDDDFFSITGGKIGWAGPLNKIVTSISFLVVGNKEQHHGG